jgi:hypothetical protein
MTKWSEWKKGGWSMSLCSLLFAALPHETRLQMSKYPTGYLYKSYIKNSERSNLSFGRFSVDYLLHNHPKFAVKLLFTLLKVPMRFSTTQRLFVFIP